MCRLMSKCDQRFLTGMFCLRFFIAEIGNYKVAVGITKLSDSNGTILTLGQTSELHSRIPPLLRQTTIRYWSYGYKAEISKKLIHLHEHSITTLWVKKNKTPNSCPELNQILADFQNSFAVRLSRKFVIKLYANTPPHPKHVATLPCEISVFKISPFLRSKWSKLLCKT